MERNYYLFFSKAPGIGRKKFDLLLRNFGSAKKAFESNDKELLKILGEKLTNNFLEFRKEFSIEKYLENLDKQKINFIALSEIKYPVNLKKISNPPVVLYTKGKYEFNSLEKYLAVVGTRRVTSYGKSVTEMFASKLASEKIVIVSGLALGVDGLAHKSSLEVSGKTVAVLGNGVDMPFPRENQKIYDEIISSGGLIVSEYAPGTLPTIGTFPARNRIVAGISDGILVTEGASDSGSLITANYGLEFGRKVFAIPGPVTSNLSAAPLKLIEKGARLVVSPDDVLKELGVNKSSEKIEKIKSENKDEQKIIEMLENESLSFDEIVRKIKFDSSRVGTILSLMEIKGIIKNSGGNYSLII